VLCRKKQEFVPDAIPSTEMPSTEPASAEAPADPEIEET
jgi:hypothetical protein